MIFNDIKEKFPFISVVKYGGEEYVGIISNQDSYITSIYVFTKLSSEDQKREFLRLGDLWWWESNRLIPINIFLKREMEVFSHILVSMNTKDVRIIFGPTVNLNKLLLKRIKRRSVQLVKKPKNN